MSHRVHNAVSLEIARRIARGLSEHSEWIDLAQDNLDRWTKQNSSAPGLLACYAEWRKILERPASEIASIMTADTDEGQRLRQNSPFAGVFSPEEIWMIKRQVHEATAA